MDYDLPEPTVMQVLPLAREYQMTTLTRRCERYLLCVSPSVQSLALAEEFQLLRLRRECLDYIQNVRICHLRQDPDFSNLCLNTQVDILMDKAVKYEKLLYVIKDILEGRKPEQKRFHTEGTGCTFLCPKSKAKHREAHTAGTDRTCRTCSLYMTKQVFSSVHSVLPTH